MKRMYILLALIAVVAVGFVLGQDYFSNSFTVENETKEVIVEKEVEVDSIEKRIKEAQAEAMADIEAEANQMRDEFIANELKTVEAAVLAEIEGELKERRTGVEKETGAYWRDPNNLRYHARMVAQNYGVSYYVMEQIINCESGWNYQVASKHRYHAGNVPRGYAVGDYEQSYGLVQIHLPAHPHVSYEQAVNPEFAIDFLARNLAAGKGRMWSCATQLALL